jgi:prophage maintenance system killer protein
MYVFLDLNGHELNVPPGELYTVAMAAANKEVTGAKVAAWLRQALQL